MNHETTPLTNGNDSILPIHNANPFAGSLEEQAGRLWELRPAANSAASSEPPPRRRRYIQLRKLVYASCYDLTALPERLETFSVENDLPVTAVTLEAQAIMAEWRGAIRGVQL